MMKEFRTKKVVKASSDPPEITLDELEDALATDDLFVEYFNHYLSLPTFPEKLCFNKETGGFEVVNDARRELSRKIKAAVRSQKRKPRIYRPVKNHSFIDIPLIPIEDEPVPDVEEIDTTFTVQALNKEQGIEWIKKERLPSFLESDCYLEYRLAKLVSQSRVRGKKGQFVSLKIDHNPRPKKVKDVEEERIKLEVEKEKLLRECYVCMGTASTTDAEAWVSQARLTQKTQTTMSSPSPRPFSAVSSASFRRPFSARPTSAMSNVESVRRYDSGYSSPARKGSAYSGGRTTAHSMYSVNDVQEGTDGSKLFDTSSKPFTPRPSETVCVVADEAALPSWEKGKVVFLPTPPIKEKTDEDEDDDDEGISQGSDISQASDTNKDQDELTFQNIDDLGSVITGTVLKYSIASIFNTTPDMASKSEELKGVFPNEKFTNLTMEDLDRMSLCEMDVGDDDDRLDDEVRKVTLESDKTEKSGKGKQGGESDEDSLLDSEEDYEERDIFFKRHKFKEYSLTNKKGIDEFQKFLSGTVGEKNWRFWIDIDRGHFMKTYQQEHNYLVAMREKYHKQGAPLELNQETKSALNLTEPSQWTLINLFKAQLHMVEPLVLYWAPRFLLKQKAPIDFSKNSLYFNQKNCRPKTAKDSGPYPDPPVISLLPLRPKSCAPRLRTSNEPEITQLAPEIYGQVDKFESPRSIPRTAPTIGWKRKYSPSALRFADGNIPKYDLGEDKKLEGSSSEDDSFTTSDWQGRGGRAQSAGSSSRASPPELKIVNGVEQSKVGHLVKPTRAKVDGDKLETQSVASAGSFRSDKSTSRSVDRSSKGSDASSVFFGGRRLEAMLQALDSEGKAGDFFKKFLMTLGNTLCLNCIDFWHEVQDYHRMFYDSVFDHFALAKKAQSINAKYIVEGASNSIKSSKDIRMKIARCIRPPYEELFDAAEELCLTTLHSAWLQMNSIDHGTFEKIELIEIKRHLETKNKYVMNLQSRGLIRQRSLTPDDPMEGYEDPVYDPILLDRIPEEFRELSLEKLVHNRIELEHFRQFLADNYASMDLLCWMDIEAFRRIPHSEEKKRDAKAKDIRTKYLTKKYFFGPNSPAGKDGQDKVMAAGGGWGKLLDERPPTQVLLEAQKYVSERLEKKWLPLFLATNEFAERQHPAVGMDDVVDDVMLQRKKKSAAVQRMLESKWVSSSKDIIAFRKALLNPVSSLQFRKYVSIKGDSLENDVLFWQEVQKYKDMYHQHSEDSYISNKINAIIYCFIDSQIPPPLQIDIPFEQAEKIIDRRREMGPYIFREAQLTVFRVLFSHWNDFCNYRSNVTDDKILPTIERLRRRAKAKETLKQKKLDEKRGREEARKRAAGIPRDSEEKGEQAYDPFSGEGQDEEAASVDDEREKIAWSYSSYLEGLDREETLNNVDESTFSSLSETGSVKGQSRPASSQKASSEAQAKTEVNDTGSPEDDNSKDDKPETVRKSRKPSNFAGKTKENGSLKPKANNKTNGENGKKLAEKQ